MKVHCDVCGKKIKKKHQTWTSSGANWCQDCKDKCPIPKAVGTRRVGRGPGAFSMTLRETPPMYMVNKAEWPKYGFDPSTITGTKAQVVAMGCSCCKRQVPTTRHSSNAHVSSGQPPDMCEECYQACPVGQCTLTSTNQGGGMTTASLEHVSLKDLLRNAAHCAEINDTQGGGLVAQELVRRGLVTPEGLPTAAGEAEFAALGDWTPDNDDKEPTVNPETQRRIEVIDMALSFGADPDTSMPLTDEKRRSLEHEKALLEGGSTPGEVKEQADLDKDTDEVMAALMNSMPQAQPEPVQTPVHTEPTGGVGATVAGPPDSLPEQQAAAEKAAAEYFAQPPVPTEPEAIAATEGQVPQFPDAPPVAQPTVVSQPVAPTPEPVQVPGLGETVKAAVSEALSALMGGSGGSSSLDDLLSKIDPRDSESALKLFTWLWENHRFQVIGKLSGGGYMLHYAEPKGTTQAGYMPGGTQGGRMVDEALARAKDNPAAAKHGMCPQCMSAVKQVIETGQVLSDDGKDDPNCPAGGNHTFAG